MKKCCFVKSDTKGDQRCPFGLPITAACQNVGEAILHCCPLEFVEAEKQETVKLANQRVYVYYKTNQRCNYAADIMENLQTVNCDFDDSAAGLHMPALSGSSLYPQTFASGGLDALYSWPLGFYDDGSSSRNLFQGLFSLVGAEDFNIIKNALPNNIKEKLANNKQLTMEERLELESMIIDCKNMGE